MTGRVLIVEDEELIARSIAFALRREGLDVETAATGPAALQAAGERPPDLVVLDLVLPGEPGGMELCATLRGQSSVPIVVVSARHDTMDKLVALERGADDYVVKPFSLPELVARIRAHLRRVELDRGGAMPTRRVGDLEIDVARRRAVIAGEELYLTRSEWELLSLLSERPGGVVTRAEIVQRLWTTPFVGDARACDAHVARLRRKIERDPRRPERLVNVRGVGYRLQAPSSAAA